MDELELLITGGLLLVVGFLLRRSLLLRRRPDDGSAARERVRESTRADQSARSMIQQMEVRLHDYGREVEGRVQTKMVVLDTLIVEAEREIERLQRLLAETDREIARPVLPLAGIRDVARHQPDIIGPLRVRSLPAAAMPPEQADELLAHRHHRARELAALGLTLDEVARCVNLSRQEVRCLLERGDSQTRAA